MPVTSARHSEILDGLRDGEGRFHGFVQQRLGALTLTDWSWGKAVFVWRLDEDDRFIMPDGVMFGGHIACVGDHIASVAALSVLENEGDRFRTSRLETEFFRPIMKPRIDIEARVVNVSRSLIHIEADYHNTEGKLAARVSAVQVLRKTDKNSPVDKI